MFESSLKAALLTRAYRVLVRVAAVDVSIAGIRPLAMETLH